MKSRGDVAGLSCYYQTQTFSAETMDSLSEHEIFQDSKTRIPLSKIVPISRAATKQRYHNHAYMNMDRAESQISFYRAQTRRVCKEMMVKRENLQKA